MRKYIYTVLYAELTEILYFSEMATFVTLLSTKMSPFTESTTNGVLT